MKTLPEKVYYRINELADAFDLKPSVLRYWQKEFSFLIKPKKNAKGESLFTQKDVENFKLIYHLVKENKYKLEGAKKKLRTERQKISKNINVIERLVNIKQQLIKIRDNL